MFQATNTAGTTFTEESPPIPVAEAFSLADLDSANTISMEFPVTVTLVNAVDRETYEGLLFDTTGTNVTVETTVQDFAISYSLEGSDTYSAYQNVSNCHVIVMWMQHETNLKPNLQASQKLASSLKVWMHTALYAEI